MDSPLSAYTTYLTNSIHQLHQLIHQGLHGSSSPPQVVENDPREKRIGGCESIVCQEQRQWLEQSLSVVAWGWYETYLNISKSQGKSWGCPWTKVKIMNFVVNDAWISLMNVIWLPYVAFNHDTFSVLGYSGGCWWPCIFMNSLLIPF